jgi:hypothetical protein
MLVTAALRIPQEEVKERLVIDKLDKKWSMVEKCGQL